MEVLADEVLRRQGAAPVALSLREVLGEAVPVRVAFPQRLATAVRAVAQLRDGAQRHALEGDRDPPPRPAGTAPRPAWTGDALLSLMPEPPPLSPAAGISSRSVPSSESGFHGAVYWSSLPTVQPVAPPPGEWWDGAWPIRGWKKDWGWGCPPLHLLLLLLGPPAGRGRPRRGPRVKRPPVLGHGRRHVRSCSDCSSVPSLCLATDGWRQMVIYSEPTF